MSLVTVSTGVILGMLLYHSHWHIHCLENTSQPNSKLSDGLKSAFEKNEKLAVNIMVNIKPKMEYILNTLNGTSIATATEFKSFLDKLKSTSASSQNAILVFLDVSSSHHPFRSLWLTNQILVEGATMDLCRALESFDEVDGIQEEIIFQLQKAVELGPIFDYASLPSNQTPWNIEKIKANEVWPMSNGKGSVVGFIDTGILSSHKIFLPDALAAWHDAVNGKSESYDDHGHGTHVAGIICGQGNVGVAPGSRVVACKGCTKDENCRESAIIQCSQFMSEQKPEIILNTWSGPPGLSVYSDVIRLWKDAGIITVFAAGNNGPSCESIGSPADNLNVISVGATTQSDSLGEFSSRGQCERGFCPSVCAPGRTILSAWSTSDTSYRLVAGTSMAASHVLGMYALLSHLKRNMNFDEGKSLILQSCTWDGLVDPGKSCGGTDFSVKPNYMYGHGRIDCKKAAEILRPPEPKHVVVPSSYSSHHTRQHNPHEDTKRWLLIAKHHSDSSSHSPSKSYTSHSSSPFHLFSSSKSKSGSSSSSHVDHHASTYHSISSGSSHHSPSHGSSHSSYKSSSHYHG